MLLDEVKKTIKDYNLINYRDKIVIGVSGGPDSVCLLHILYSLKKEFGLKLIVAHVNYKSRGKDSDRDEDYVRKLAKKLGLKLYVARRKMKSKRQKTKNIEEKFREIRYDFFNRVLKKERADKIAVAHTKDDQVETIIMFFLRGAGLRGLSGMDIARDKIIRPLLFASRTEILEYLKKHKLKYQKDITNADITFTRNKIRHKLIPYLELEFNPNLKNTLAAAACAIKDDHDLLSQISENTARNLIKKRGEMLEINLAKFQVLHPALKRKVLVLALELAAKKTPRITFSFLFEILRMIEKSKTGAKKPVGKLKIFKKRDKIVITITQKHESTKTKKHRNKRTRPINYESFMTDEFVNS
jgi:tRNA(Ile)-lysidine synthase